MIVLERNDKAMVSCWLITYKDGTKKILNENAHNTESYRNDLKDNSISSEQHWFDMGECIKENPRVEKIIL